MGGGRQLYQEVGMHLAATFLSHYRVFCPVLALELSEAGEFFYLSLTFRRFFLCRTFLPEDSLKEGARKSV